MEKHSIDDVVIDVEWAALNSVLPPRGRKYRYKVDGVSYETEKESLTGREILEGAGKIPPEKFILREKIRGQWQTVELNHAVDFTTTAVEKFKTLPNDQIDGENSVKSPRRDFALLEEDEDYLNSLGLVRETVRSVIGNSVNNWVLVHGFRVISGYNVNTAVMAINMLPGYPDSQLDMVYFYPSLSRRDHQAIPNLTLTLIDGKEFQQWSRHRTNVNPWRPGIDNLSTHVPLAELWLANEFQKRPSYAVPV